MAEAATPLDAARAALRRRQGLGARFDAANAPARELDWARRGTAFFARALNELSDAALSAPSRVPGWSRRQVIAETACQARRLARVVRAARTGERPPAPDTPDRHAAEIADAATLPPEALRHLVHHAAVHLTVEWRDLAPAQWDAPLPFGSPASARETPWLRARLVWLRAVDLGTGADVRDFPRDLLAALLAERLGALPEAADLPALARRTLLPARATG